MTGMPEWRAVDPGPQDPATAEPRPPEGTVDWRKAALVAACIAAVAAGALAMSLVAPPGPHGGQGLLVDVPAPPTDSVELPLALEPTVEEALLVDVAGAVERPGLYRLTAGSRVGDAISAAGGYAATVDLDLAARQLNLAERVTDGGKVHVPRRGEHAVAGVPDPLPGIIQPGSAGSAGPLGPDGQAALIDINVADGRLLETLPGIGPVTAGKIISAREEARFVDVDDLLARKVVGPATFEKIRALVTAAP
jgi:competence protein ComEA